MERIQELHDHVQKDKRTCQACSHGHYNADEVQTARNENSQSKSARRSNKLV